MTATYTPEAAYFLGWVSPSPASGEPERCEVSHHDTDDVWRTLHKGPIGRWSEPTRAQARAVLDDYATRHPLTVTDHLVDRFLTTFGPGLEHPTHRITEHQLASWITRGAQETLF